MSASAAARAKSSSLEEATMSSSTPAGSMVRSRSTKTGGKTSAIRTFVIATSLAGPRAYWPPRPDGVEGASSCAKDVLVWSGGFGHDQALRAGEGDVLDEAPTRFRQPVANFIDAVDIAVAHMRGELAGHQCGV